MRQPGAITVIVGRSFSCEGISSDSKEPVGHMIWQRRLQLSTRLDMEEEGREEVRKVTPHARGRSAIPYHPGG